MDKILGFWGFGLTSSPGEMKDKRSGLLLIKLVGGLMDGTMGREALGLSWGRWMREKKLPGWFSSGLLSC